MRLEKLEIKDFKLEIYKYYKKIFPLSVRKPYSLLKDSYKRGISCFYKILVDDNCVGFIIVNFLDSFKCIILDYLAILPKYQSKGYGKGSIKMLSKIYSNYEICVEVEKEDALKKDAEIRKRRINFYESNGFKKLNFYLDYYNVIYSIYCLSSGNEIDSDDKILDNMMKLYITILGQKCVNKNIKVLYE